MDIFEKNNFEIFNKTLDNINMQYQTILSVFNGDIHEYIDKASSPFDITIPLTEVLKFVDANYIDMCGQVSKVFESIHNLSVVSSNFVKYYELLQNSINSNDDSVEGKTMKIALVLILANCSISNFSTSKIEVVLRSMCNMPTVGLLVNVSNTVLGYSLD